MKAKFAFWAFSEVALLLLRSSKKFAARKHRPSKDKDWSPGIYTCCAPVSIYLGRYSKLGRALYHLSSCAPIKKRGPNR